MLWKLTGVLLLLSHTYIFLMEISQAILQDDSKPLGQHFVKSQWFNELYAVWHSVVGKKLSGQAQCLSQQQDVELQLCTVFLLNYPCSPINTSRHLLPKHITPCHDAISLPQSSIFCLSVCTSLVNAFCSTTTCSVQKTLNTRPTTRTCIINYCLLHLN